MTVRPGYGIRELHLRQPWSEIQNRLGPPTSSVDAGALRTYHSYPDLGFDCIVSRRSDRVLSMFFRRAASGSQELMLSIEIGPLPFGETRQRLIEQQGQPDESGDAIVLSTGDFVGGWVSYNRGLGFHFDREDRVEMVSIFAPSRHISEKVSKRDMLEPAREPELRRAG